MCRRVTVPQDERPWARGKHWPWWLDEPCQHPWTWLDFERRAVSGRGARQSGGRLPKGSSDGTCPRQEFRVMTLRMGVATTASFSRETPGNLVLSAHLDIWMEISVYNRAVLSLTVEYALRAAAFLSQHNGQSCTVQDIAADTQVPPDYLSKVMSDLRRAGLVRSKPGRNGGYTLDRLPSDITLLEVVGAVEPIRLIDRCPLNKPCHAHQLCPLHLALRSAAEALANSLRASTLACLETTGRRDDPTQAVSGSAFVGEGIA